MDFSAQQEASLQSVFSALKDQIDQLMLLLSQKEKFVVERRFNLHNERRETLEEIGQHFDVTRERVRQIEKNALQKLRRNIENFDVFKINDLAYSLLRERGGVLREDELLSSLILRNGNVNTGALLLILSLDKRFERFTNTIQYHPYFTLVSLPLRAVEDLSSKCIVLLKELKKVLPCHEAAAKLRAKDESYQNLSDEFFSSLFRVCKQLKLVEEKNVGLIEWRHINPRTLRDKIYFILREHNSPMHFVEIANTIVSHQFDRKSLNLQAVHNELIRYPDFVLIGRGIYALKEWGYEHGTVADVIQSVLSAEESLSEDEIIAEVLKRRKVKSITIILNLKNKPQFVRVGRKQYTLKSTLKS